MTIGEYINETIENQGRTRAWVAERCNVNYKTFSDKIKYNRFTAEELIKVSMVLNFDLEKMKEKVES